MLHIIRFTGLVIGLIFVMHTLKTCAGHAYPDGEAAGERHVAGEETVNQKEFLDGFGGRKMGGHEVVVRKEMLEVGASKNSGANRFDGKCDFEGKGSAFNVKCKSWNENSSDPNVETVDFVAFGADYRGPKRHPPKHN